ncbi:MAG: ABC transporter ATP-binding protein [Clostridia bacterium]|nr:ABC transporter ATP-binding protein [Clostridia bacterium]
MASLKLSGVNKVYPSGETALYDINLEAKDKEFLVLVGADGCGKSSLLRVVAGLEDATSGSVFIDDKDMVDVEPKNRDIAMVFQSSTLYPSLNVFDNMAFGLRLRKAPEALVRERVKVVANILGLNDILYRKPKVLNAASKQRVAIARAIVREPKLYLFDEPLSGLDDKLKADMLNVIINLQARLEGTFVYATKNLSEALTIGTRLVVLKDGFVQQIDTPANLYDYPANTYVAFYIGSPTINFIKKVKISEEDGKYFAVFGEYKLELPENIVSRFESIAEYAASGKYVTLGIRPEDAELCEDGNLTGTVDKVTGEDGEDKYAEVDVTNEICLNALAKNGAEKGKKTGVKVDLTRLYIFDAASCLTLLKRDAGYTETGFEDANYVPLAFDEEVRIHESLKPNKKNKKK